jgi:phosphohistidine phosphatase
MMLWLLRHADAANGTPDDERPLTEEGVAQARAAGRALAALGVKIELCLTSPKRRAVQTAELACAALGIEPVVEPALGGQPFDPPALAAGIENVLLVGHDPAFSVALHDLTGVQARMSKGGVAGVMKGELLVLLRPTEVAAIARAECPDTVELRETVQ